jgi:hypothetical protein
MNESRRDFLRRAFWYLSACAARKTFQTFCFTGGSYRRSPFSSGAYWKLIPHLREYLKPLTWLICFFSRLAVASSLLRKLVLIQRRWFLLHGAHSPKPTRQAFAGPYFASAGGCVSGLVTP